VQIFIAGDANADTQVDGSDAQIVTASAWELVPAMRVMWLQPMRTGTG
jgi:hypothetical protein